MTRRAVRTARLGVVVMAMAVAASSCGSERVSTGATPTSPTTTGQPARSGEPPADEPDFVGTITSRSVSPASNNVVGTILVESSRSEPVGILGDEASITIASATPIWRCDDMSNLVQGSFADLVTDGYVSVWVDGPVAESYPVQAKASAVKALIGGCD